LIGPEERRPQTLVAPAFTATSITTPALSMSRTFTVTEFDALYPLRTSFAYDA